MFKSKAADPDPADQLTEAKHRCEALQAERPTLQTTLEQAVTHRQSVQDALRLAEGDALIGAISDTTLAEKRHAVEEANKAESTADAHLRKNARDIELANDALKRLASEANKAEIEAFRQQMVDAVQEALPALEQVVPIMAKIAAIYTAAEARFPHAYPHMRSQSRSYPVAAGLPNLAWHEFLHMPNAIDGGRLGHWRRLAEEFLNPKPPAPPKPRRVDALPQRASAMSAEGKLLNY